MIIYPLAFFCEAHRRKMISETDDDTIELPSRQTTENQGRWPPSFVLNIFWLHRSDFMDFYLYLCMILGNSINAGKKYLITFPVGEDVSAEIGEII